MAARDEILSGDFTVYYAAENNRKQIEWTGSATGTRTLNELYSALQDLFDEPSQMDDLIPIRADTPDIYRIINQWFIDDTTVEHLNFGSLFTDGWISGTTEHVKVIGYDPATTEFSTHDIGRTIVGGTTGDTGTILDFNTIRNLVWIRPDDPTLTGDDFDDGDEAYQIQDDPLAQVWQVDDDGGPSFVDFTTEANDAAGADWDLFPATEAADDYVAFGFAQEFSKLTLDNAGGTAGVGGTVDWEYWNGSAWSSLETGGFTDGTSDFTTAAADGQEVIWDPPSDWEQTSLNGEAQLYYVRAVVTGVYSTNPVYDQGFVSGQGVGTFADNPRHGSGSVGGEAAWAGITTIGSIQPDTHLYIYRESPDRPAGDFEEELVVATKGTSDWWDNGQINILLKTKEADSIFGRRPSTGSNSLLAIATVFARKFTTLYSHFIAESLSTAGGNTVVPLASGNDLNNQNGFRSLLMSSDSGNFIVGDRISNDASTPIAVITAITGTTPTRTLEYYLIGDPLTDFSDLETVTNLDDTGTGTVDGAPVDVNSALLTNVTVVFGETFEDINNGNGSRPFSIRINPDSELLTDVYERLKYITRRGSAEVLLGQVGEEYIGNELQIEYSSQAGGNFSEGDKVFDQTTNAEGIIVADHDDGATGDLIVKAVRGTFVSTNTISDSPSPSQTLGSAQQFEDGVGFTDFTTEAAGAGGGDVDPFPATESVNDYFAIGGAEVWATANIDISTAGVDGGSLALAWEYWNGSTWADLESVPNFVDNTADFTTGTGFSTVVFYPPRDWEPTTLNAFGPLYYIRARITAGSYSTNPVLQEVQLLDNVTATADSLRSIAPVSASPFGTLAGGRFFGAPGVTLTTANLDAGEVQSFQLIDDNGITQIPPNTVAISVTNLISGDRVAVFRRTGTVINKTEFTLATANDEGDTTVVVNESISTDTPTNANSKIRVVSSNGCEHRYRYASYSGSTFTLSAASTGTADAGSTTTVLFDAAADFVTDGVEVGDYVRNTTDDFFARVVEVTDLNTLVTETVSLTWEAKAYSVNTLVENYPENNNAYVPFIERVADATTESNQLVQSVNIDVRVVVRNAGVILPFSQDATIGSTGLSIAAIRNPDDIFT